MLDLAELKPEHAELPRRIRDVLRVYGYGPDRATCGQCARILVVRGSKKYYKCPLVPVTHGAATDWRLSWPACGKFVSKEEKGGDHAAQRVE